MDAMTLSKMTLCIMTLSIMTFIIIKNETLSDTTAILKKTLLIPLINVTLLIYFLFTVISKVIYNYYKNVIISNDSRIKCYKYCNNK